MNKKRGPKPTVRNAFGAYMAHIGYNNARMAEDLGCGTTAVARWKAGDAISGPLYNVLMSIHPACGIAPPGCLQPDTHRQPFKPQPKMPVRGQRLLDKKPRRLPEDVLALRRRQRLGLDLPRVYHPDGTRDNKEVGYGLSSDSPDSGTAT